MVYCRELSRLVPYMYWILDKGYLVYLFSVAYLHHWKWPFVFKTILAAAKTLIQGFGISGQNCPDSSSLGTIHF